MEIKNVVWDIYVFDVNGEKIKIRDTKPLLSDDDLSKAWLNENYGFLLQTLT